jgi:uncharacterized protein YukE
MGLLDGVLKLVQKVVESVLSEVTKQVNRVQNEVLNEMTKMISGPFDEIWRGEDADQFKEKIQKMAVPKAENILGVVGGIGNGIKQAINIIQSADKKANQIVGDIASEFSKI